ncbi:MAG: BamA/TamA family outer membrane protein [Alkalispirochaeta sp.]
MLLVAATASAQEPNEEYRHWAVVPVPIIAYSPDTGGMFGLAAMFFYGPDVGIPEDARRGLRNNVASVNGIWTTSGSYVAAVSATNYLAAQRYRWDNSFGAVYAPGVYFGIGPNADSEETYTEMQLGGETRFSFLVAPDVYLGPLFQWESVSVNDTESDGELAAGLLTGSHGDMFLSGSGLGLIRDTTGGVFWPEDGSVATADVRGFSPLVGSSESFGLYRLQYARYLPVWSDHILALQGRLCGSWGEVPFQYRPSIGGDGVMRGLLKGRYRDTVSAIAQVEYRMPVSRSVAIVGFGSAGQVGTSVAGLSPNGVKGAGGVGFRVALNKDQRLNLRIDVAIAPSGVSPYLNMGEAF